MSTPAYLCSSCQRPFITLGALHYHARSCSSSKKRLGGALEKVREARKDKKDKRRRLDAATPVLLQPSTKSPMSNNDPLSLPRPEGNDATASGPSSSEPLTTNNSPIVLVEHREDRTVGAEKRPQRTHKMPGRYVDFIPHTAILPPPDPTPAVETPQDSQPLTFKSRRSVFGLCKTYFSVGPPDRDPDDNNTLSDLSDYPLQPTKGACTVSLPKQPSYYPYPNYNSFALGNWYWNHGAQKSQQDFKALLDIIGSPRFKSEDVQSTPWNRINATLGSNDFDHEDQRWEWEDEDAGWRRTRINLDVPFHTRMKNTGTHCTVIGDLYHRSIVSVLKEKLANSTDACHIHYEPYELTWRPSSKAEEMRVYGELYTSPALLPDSFKDFASEHIGGKGTPTPAFLAHCRRELFHTQWSILLDEEFLDAWLHGIVIMCLDGIRRRFYPRIITYSADYPEKALLASIRNGGRLPCPRCFISKTDLGMMGTASDMEQRVVAIRINDHAYKKLNRDARRIIYNQNFAVNSKAVELLLQPTSLVASSNAFAGALGDFGFNHHQMLVVDILHEWEVGVWKSVLTHLIRLVHESQANHVSLLDARYRQIDTFGKDTIRRFSSNTSEMKRLGARDFADLLQGRLLPEPHNARLMDLLFICATWHGLAKLRLHTDKTLQMLDEVTVSLGNALRNFVTLTCSKFKTRELPREAAARVRRTALPARGKQSSTVPKLGGPSVAPGNTTRKPKSLNLNTYKFHSIGDVAATIRTFGTTDSYSTEIGELEHRTVKARYRRTDRKEYSKQIARIERREARLRHIQAQSTMMERADDDSSSQADPSVHHVMGKTENLPIYIGIFAEENDGDPAVKVRTTYFPLLCI
ncbi:hypothetical protein DXG01_016127 [Tephrocybe rancida]|nr:hypothetical protein DXG01_016127 [Tephrocybe rancida]